MTSTIPHNVFDDDDEFDWEAAVREIDVACEASKQSTSNPIHHPLAETNTQSSINTHKESFASRQSTLDRFIQKERPGVRLEKENVWEINQDKVEASEGVSCVKIDSEAAKTWIYPVNIPLRDYQLAITKTALFSNTLVALPTGLGKTLIAAVVMYNYFRWFPEGKIIFTAPSRPLVMQQIEACHNIVGMPQEWTIDMTGQTSPTKRACFWKTKRVFFVTPQVLERDIQSGTCEVKHIVCLVIDEAHRASGNYSYCVVVRELMSVPVELRILALTATPGSKHQTIQLIIDNLQISTLEYRNESDPDVRPYVHDRKIELIEVDVPGDAVDIDNMLLEVIRPFVARLRAIGVLPSRDLQTLSPCELLNVRDRFRQAPPLDLPTTKYGEVECCIGVLITLYHVRKLLLSHGVRPAYDMLEGKLRQGTFVQVMSKNEAMWKVKLLMQQSLSHPNPKFSTMLEVLIDHFKMKDPQNSRVIIFSNFRGSVRDIVDALMNIGDFVKATEFVGQSSGKALKGQSQKVQQAVLEKFRAGGYNVIVSTSIGEEGLDIMEVDLVICYDANVSPLRMIQRMGRTGRKHDGRVVVLAFKGPELKGYLNKLASSKSINKRMRNGGTNSFNFHCSPRMIPHIFKPEVQFVEISIEQFIPRGRKVNDDYPIQTPMFNAELTDAETDLVAKYFHPTKECTWRPSLIAFPHFQAFPSRVHKIMHSFRTEMLIDAMQVLQGLSFTRVNEALIVKDEVLSSLGLEVETVGQLGDSRKDFQSSHNSLEEHLLRKISNSDPLPKETFATEEKHSLSDCHGKNPPVHSYLFGSDFASVDSLGRVLILSVPLIPINKVSRSKCTSVSNRVLLPEDYKEMNVRTKYFSDQTDSSRTGCKENKSMPTSESCYSDAQQENKLDEGEKILLTPVSKVNLSNEVESIVETPCENKTEVLLVDDSTNDLRDVELSPRLSDFIKSGVVPESPIDYTGRSNARGRGELMVPKFGSSAKSPTGASLMSLIPEQEEKTLVDVSACGRDVLSSSFNDEIRTPVINVKCSAAGGSISAFPIIEEVSTPLANSTNSCSKEWCLNSGGKSKSVQQEKKFKRLRKYGDQGKRRPLEVKEGSIGPTANLTSSCARPSPILVKNVRGKRKKHVKDVRSFIEDEAEVSSEVEVSDEEDDQDIYSYDDSFIDDRINPTEASFQPETSRTDMMAIYRHSLLSQSPMESTDFSPSSVAPKTRIRESRILSGMTNHSLQTPQSGSESAGTLKFEKSISNEVMPSTTNGIPTSSETENKMRSLKRKLSFYQVGSVPAINLDQEFLLHSEAAGRETSFQDQVPNIGPNGVAFDDDDLFYEGLDLDAVEEQAVKLLGYKSELSEHKIVAIPDPSPPLLDVLGSPSFDLGI
ncbi:DEAD-box ATP-dependent RNA helicase FANCM isoform X2 [Actinidia eriantha]|uniref:DEAD-box ATP-dependent RNA helicase FANCM isoform X2 n=1 Tax=Actinidia eriantha TaxID=165200 RepID=UPI00258CF3F8|nr:DEAD-box ATP-dependent RNA helicase FANCM isoform X2 [Actinidia eriantha]